MGEFLKDSPRNWGKWGADDEIGSLNYLDAGQVLRGVQHVKQGKVHTLQVRMCDPAGDPVWPGRRGAERLMVFDEGSWHGDRAPQFPGGLHYADDFITAFLQGSSQYDALGHVWYDGQIYNGYDANTTIGGLSKASVLPIAEHGIVGRGILLDMARFRGKDSLAKGETFTHEDLIACAKAQGTEIQKRDILCIRTGWIAAYRALSAQERCSPELSARFSGLRADDETARFLWNNRVAAVTIDNPGFEVAPGRSEDGFLHRRLLPMLGFVIGELLDLDTLAEVCAEIGRYEFQFVAVPLPIPGGLSSPSNAMVIL
jgi:kynurenine formamidase